MTSRKSKSAAYQVGYRRPPRHTRFRKGRSGNPGGRPRRAPTERAKALALREAYRKVTVKEGDRTFALPAIQAILRSQVMLAAKGNLQAQRAVLAAIQTIEEENTWAAKFAAIGTAAAVAHVGQNAGETMSYAEAARRVRSLLRLDEKEIDGEKNRAVGATPAGTADASAAKPGAA
jgi:hypothetical protein